jgi:hypothetical protein
MLPKLPDASLQKQLRGMMPSQSFSRASKPAFPDYSGWSLKPEFRQDLGERADFMEGLLRMFGPSMPGGLGKMFHNFMSPPAGGAPPQENSFARMLSGRAPRAGQRMGAMSFATNRMLGRRA